METRTRTLCIILIILVLAGLGGVFVFWQVIKASILKVHEVNAAVENQVLHRKENIALQALLDEIGPQIDSLKTRIVGVNDTVSFIDTIETLSKKTGAAATVDAVNEKPAIEGKDYEYIEMRLSTTGSWKQVHTFVSMVESLPYKVTIEDLTLDQETAPNQTASSTRSQAKPWKAVVTITVLKQK